MIIENEAHVTPVVQAAMAGIADERLRQIGDAFVRHLHAFAREVKLTESEWEAGIATLNRIGQTTNDAHNEAILFSDAVGLSTLVCLLNNGASGATETAAALLGPFWRPESPATPEGGSIIRSPTPGPSLLVRAQVMGPGRTPLAGVDVDVWHASSVGLYDNQDPEQAKHNLRGTFTTDAQGRFSFTTIKPVGYPIPMHGPTGTLVTAQNRHNNRPAHLHFLLFKPGMKTLITQVYADDCAYLESDVVFGVTQALVGSFARNDLGPDDGAPDYTLDYVFHMEPGEATRPIPPIA